MMKHQLMNKIRQADFAMQETVLFLDTHPNCRRALRYYEEVRKKSMYYRAEYEKNFGPVTICGNENTDKWMWVKTPWPWQAEGCHSECGNAPESEDN